MSVLARPPPWRTRPQVPAAMWAFMELFGEWGGTWSLLLDLTAMVVLLNHTAVCARKGRSPAQRCHTTKNKKQQKRKVTKETSRWKCDPNCR